MDSQTLREIVDIERLSGGAPLCATVLDGAAADAGGAAESPA